MRKIRNNQGHYEWKLCFLGGVRGGYEPRNTKPAMSPAFISYKAYKNVSKCLNGGEKMSH